MDRETMMKAMREATSNVLETMFYQPIHITDANCSLKEWFSDTQLLVGVTLSFRGPSRGLFYLFLPTAMVTRITANFLGLDEEEVNEEQKNDAVKESLNMIGGNMLSFFDKQGVFKLDIPELIEGNNLSVDKFEGLEGSVIFIETEENRLAAGIVIE